MCIGSIYFIRVFFSDDYIFPCHIYFMGTKDSLYHFKLVRSGIEFLIPEDKFEVLKNVW